LSNTACQQDKPDRDFYAIDDHKIGASGLIPRNIRSTPEFQAGSD